MKTNRKKPFILATLALGLVLVMGLGANTFAKYLTTNDGSASAQVAKWGVTIAVNPDELFSKNYENGADVAENGDVIASGTTSLVAPGTGDDINFAQAIQLSGTPEVDVKVTITATITDEVTYTDDTHPIVWKDGDATITLEDDGTKVITVTTFYNANTDLSTVTPNCPAISWAWALNGNDAEDTILGNAAAEGNAATVSIAFEVSIEQVQQSAQS